MATAGADNPLTAGELNRQLGLFLSGSPGSASAGLLLLRTVPVARDAVLEHAALNFDLAIKAHLTQPSDAQPQPLDKALQDVSGVLLSFIKAWPEAWAPVVSAWALSLLGQVSSKYASTRGLHSASSLEEVLQMWMACPAAHMLIEITTECLAAMVGGAPDACVDALLEASVRHSPHFDWVVAHVGSCFPRTIITRVLHCGLKDFTAGGADASDSAAMPGRPKVPKMASVVGILGHLASKHGPDIRKALKALFESSLTADPSGGRVTLLPFLLQLASMSEMLLDILTSDLVSQLTPSVLNILHRQFTRWKHAAPGEYNAFLNLVVHLIYKSNSGAQSIMEFILRTAAPEVGTKNELPVEEVRDTCVEIVHILLFELQRGVLSRRPEHAAAAVPLLQGLASGTGSLIAGLVGGGGGNRQVWLEKLLTFTALQAGETAAADILATLLCRAPTGLQLATFYRVKRGVEAGLPGIAGPTVKRIVARLAAPQPHLSGHSKQCSGDINAANALKNLERLVIAEGAKLKKKLVSTSVIVESLRGQLPSLVQLLSPPGEASAAALSLLARLLRLAGFPPGTALHHCAQFASTLTLTLLQALHLRSSSAGLPGSGRMAQKCLACLERLCQLPAARCLVIQHLMEAAEAPEHRGLFGQPSRGAGSDASGGSLMEHNQAVSLAAPSQGTKLGALHHGGIMRNSGLVNAASEALPKDLVSRNCLTMMEGLWLCCREAPAPSAGGPGVPVPVWGAPANGQPQPMDTDERLDKDERVKDKDERFKDKDERVRPGSGVGAARVREDCARVLGCAVVQALTLDSLYNDVHWPEPDFRRLTTERDTVVWRRLEEMPVFLSVLREFSSSCVFVYYVSPVLRSLLAVAMAQLEASRADTAVALAPHCETAATVVLCLARSGLLPPPLSRVAELLPRVSPYQAFLLLLAVWRYIRDNPPSEFEAEVAGRGAVGAGPHTEVVAAILQANIQSLGPLAPRVHRP